MRLTDSRWLTDENVHPDVVAHLRGRRLDVLDVRERGWHGWSDDQLLEEARREGRIILTHDGDFGTLALLGGRPVVGIVRVDALDHLLALDLDPSPPFLVVVQRGLVRLHTWGGS